MDPNPTPPRSRAAVDLVNTAAWFAMDAFWLAGLAGPAYLAAGLAAATGVWLVALGWRESRGALYADLGLNCWIAMNTVWMAHDLNGAETPKAVAGVLGPLGAGFLFLAARHSRDFRRVRVFRR